MRDDAWEPVPRMDSTQTGMGLAAPPFEVAGFIGGVALSRWRGIGNISIAGSSSGVPR